MAFLRRAAATLAALSFSIPTLALAAPPSLPSPPPIPSTWPSTWSVPPLPPGFPLPAPSALPAGLPAWPGGLTLPSGVPTLPTVWPRDPAQVLAELAKCPPIEVAPGLRIPVPCDPSARPPGPTSGRTHYPPMGVLPPRVDLAPLVGRVKNQEQVGVCWAFALSSVTEVNLRRQNIVEEISPLHLVAALSEQRLDASGSKGTAIASERAWPYETTRACMLNDVLRRPDLDCESAYHVQSGSWRRSPVIVGELARADQLGQYRVKRTYLSKEPDELATVLAEGRAVILGIRVDSVAWGGAGARGGTLAEYGDGNRGGHDVMVTGYTWVGPVRYFRLQNSWGTGWGDGGRVWISESNLRRHIMDAAIVDVYPRDAVVKS